MTTALLLALLLAVFSAFAFAAAESSPSATGRRVLVVHDGPVAAARGDYARLWTRLGGTRDNFT